MAEVRHHDKYLGLPTILGRSKKVVLASIKERVWKKLWGYKERLLSNPGKEVILKAVAQAIPIYAMSVFKFPESLLMKSTSFSQNFGGVLLIQDVAFIGGVGRTSVYQRLSVEWFSEI